MSVKQDRDASKNSAANSLRRRFSDLQFRCRQRGEIASKSLMKLSVFTLTGDFLAPKRIFSQPAGTGGSWMRSRGTWETPRSAGTRKRALLADQGQDKRA